MSIVVVTGTDTGVGKTFVTCALATALRARGRRVAVMKPIETGVDGEPEDASRLRAAAADPAPLDAICPYRFRAPLAPAMAARAEGATIDVPDLVARARRRAAEADVLLVEGAGGLLVPITTASTFLDFAMTLGGGVLVVAANRLGTINHSALTIRVATAAGLRVRGVVLSQPASDTDGSAATNAEMIALVAGVRDVTTLPHLARPADAAPLLADVAARLDDLRTLEFS